MGEESYAAVSWRTETRTIHSERKVWGKIAMKKRQLDGKKQGKKECLGKENLIDTSLQSSATIRSSPT